MIIVNKYIKSSMMRCVSSATNSFQSGAKNALHLVVLAALILSGPAAFSAVAIDGVLSSSRSSKKRADEARYERVNVLWAALVDSANGETRLPNWTVKEVLTFTTGVHLGIDYEFSERQIFNILPDAGETTFNVKDIAIPEYRQQVLNVFEDASLLFYSLQENYKHGGDLSELRLPGDLEQADRFFSNSLKQDILLQQKTSFAKNDRNKWQELVITGLWREEELTLGSASEETLKNHALVQSILWVGRELIETIENDTDWTGPKAINLDQDDFPEDFKVERSSLESQDTGPSRKPSDYLNEVELSLYWAIKGILFYESKRMPRYNETTGVLTSDPPAEVLLAQCFHRVYHSFEDTLAVIEEVNVASSTVLVGAYPAEISDSGDVIEATSVSPWLEARSIDAKPLVSDKLALNFIYSNLPGGGPNERSLFSILNSIQGASSVTTIARYWASVFEDRIVKSTHPGYKTLSETLDRVDTAYHSALTALESRDRVSRRRPDVWIKPVTDIAVSELEEEIETERRNFRRSLALNFITLVALPVAIEGIVAADLAVLSANDARLIRSFWVAYNNARESGIVLRVAPMLQQLSPAAQYMITTGFLESRLYSSVGLLAAFGAQLTKFFLVSTVD